MAQNNYKDLKLSYIKGVNEFITISLDFYGKMNIESKGLTDKEVLTHLEYFEKIKNANK